MRFTLRLMLSAACPLAIAASLPMASAIDRFKACTVCSPGCPSACGTIGTDSETFTDDRLVLPQELRPMTRQQEAQMLNELGRAATDNSDYETAIKHFERALRLDPANRDITTNLRWAQDSLRARDARLAEDSGDEAYDREDWNAAIAHYGRALEKDPRNERILEKSLWAFLRVKLQLGRDARKRGNRMRAIEYFEEACELSPQSNRWADCDPFHMLAADAAHERGDAASALGKWATATLHYRRALRHDPHNDDIAAKVDYARVHLTRPPALIFTDTWSARPADRNKLESSVKSIATTAVEKQLARNFTDWLKENVTIELVSRQGSPLIDPFPLGMVPGKLNVHEWFLHGKRDPKLDQEDRIGDIKRTNLLSFEFGKTLWADINDGAADVANTRAAHLFARLRDKHVAIGEMRFAARNNLGNLDDNDIESHFAFALRVVLFDLGPPTSASAEVKADWADAKKAMKKYLEEEVL